MPNITVELLSGRSVDQRRAFVEAVTEAAVNVLEARRQDVRIRFDEIERGDVANGGVLESERQAR
jgi:4-oxalocrotonate tautomerase